MAAERYAREALSGWHRRSIEGCWKTVVHPLGVVAGRNAQLSPTNESNVGICFPSSGLCTSRRHRRLTSWQIWPEHQDGTDERWALNPLDPAREKEWRRPRSLPSLPRPTKTHKLSKAISKSSKTIALCFRDAQDLPSAQCQEILPEKKLVRHVFSLHTIAASPGVRRTAEKSSRYVRGTGSTFIQRQRPSPVVFPIPSHKHQLRLPVSYRPDVRGFACPISHSHAASLLQWYHPARQKVAS